MDSSSTEDSYYKPVYDKLLTSYEQLQSCTTVGDYPQLLSTWNQSLRDVINKCFIDVHQNLMDDSGLSDQPFFIEGDAFLLNILTDREFDTPAQGSTLQFTFLIEKQLAALAEGGRKIAFIFFDTHGKAYGASPYLTFLRLMGIAYIKHSLSIPVYTFAAPGQEVLALYNDESPSFTLLSDGYLTTQQEQRLQALAKVGSPQGTVDLEQLRAKSRALLVQLVQAHQRCARYNEVSILDGMLQALLITIRLGAKDVAVGAFTCTLSNDDDNRLYAPVTGTINDIVIDTTVISTADASLPKGMATVGNNHHNDAITTTITAAINNISSQCVQGGIQSERVLILVLAMASIIKQYNNNQQAMTAFATALFTALVLDHLPLPDRPQYKPQDSQEVFQKILPHEGLSPLLQALSVVSLSLALMNEDSSIITHNTNALSDIFDGYLSTVLFAENTPHITAVQQVFDTSCTYIDRIWSLIGKISGVSLCCTATSLLKPLLPAAGSSTAAAADAEHEVIVAQSITEVPEPLADCPPAASIAVVQWKELPPIDPQILRVLLNALGDDERTYKLVQKDQSLKTIGEAGSDDNTTDAAKSDTTSPDATTTTGAAAADAKDDGEDDLLDDWDAEELDDWDAESIPEEEPEPEPEPVAEATTDDTTEDTTTTPQGPPTHMKLLGGAITFNINSLVNYWETHQMVSDGATMQAAQSESMYRHNPIRLSRDTRFMLRKLLEESRDPKTRAYQMPPDDKIRQRVEVAHRELTIDKAKMWFRTTIENFGIKAENQRIARAKSTKKEYNQSMITPSRIVLRDIVATEQEEQAGDDNTSANNTNNNNNNNHSSGNKKKGGGAGRHNANRKETVQDRVARETQEKQAKQDMDRVLSYIHTVRNMDLARRINELDKKLLAHADLPSALHGLMVLLEWRVEYWKYCVQNRRMGTPSPSAATNATTAAGTDASSTTDSTAVVSSPSGSTSTTLSSASALNEAHLEVAVRLYQLLADLSRRFLHIMTHKQVQELQKAYAMLGFFESEIEVDLRYSNATGLTNYSNDEIRDLVQTHLRKAKTTSERRFNVGLSRARFLLQYAGHVLLRNVKSAKDIRVDGFYPDKWQRQLLDIVDNNESAIVVAPTSAGKTLVSFYAVERVLRANKALRPNEKKGIVVFVAPTFPLARQMEADITNRNKDAEVVVHDHFLRLVSMKFDVLITLPSCLENLLTSPYRAEWVSRIKYVVFDEVHSIGSTLHGPVWERLFLLSYQSPFLALSATVGGADHFHQWLINMRQRHEVATSGVAKGAITVAGIPIQGVAPPSEKVHKVVTTVRWSHLHHYFYVPSSAFLEEAIQDARTTNTNAVGLYLPNKDTNDQSQQQSPQQQRLATTTSSFAGNKSSFVPLHPVATLSLNKNSVRDIHGIYNVEFSSSDVLQLYETMQAVMAKSPRFHPPNGKQLDPNDENDRKILVIVEKFEKLNPDQYFGFFVEKVHVLEYETQLKDVLLLWHDAVLDTELLEVINLLSNDLQQILQPLCIATRARRELWKKEFVNLVYEIKHRDWFPALIFCLDRTLCTELAYVLMEHLEAVEHAQWVKEDNKRLDVKAREREIERQLRLLKRARDAKGKGSAEAAKEAEEEERMGLVDNSLPTNVKPYNPDDWNADPPDERFSFINETETMSEEVKTYWERRLNRAGRAVMTGQHPLVRGLFRGFGVHHYGVDKQYRDLVEILFRQRNLKFVISTETLGLGVNMPCRTAVLAFTTTQLNPLNYRQMSGRAGRRGFDDKGQVIFFGIDPYSACRLMTSSLTPLRGHFNLTCTTVLRSCVKHYFLRDNLANGVTTNIALADKDSFLTRSFYSFSEQYPEHVRVQLVHYFRFCLAYFTQFGLFNNEAPTGLAYLMSTIASFTNSRGVNSESGAFILGYLLRSGFIDELCSDFDTNPDAVGERLMTLLSHLFFPLRLRNGATPQDYPSLPPLTKGHVVLPALESTGDEKLVKVANAIDAHDSFVLKLFARYCLAISSSTEKLAKFSLADAAAMATSATTTSDAATTIKGNTTAALAIEAKEVLSQVSALPFSSRSLAVSSTDDNMDTKAAAGEGFTALTTSLHNSAVQPSVRSLFNALSFQGDVFEDPLSLASTSRQDISLRVRQLPINVERFEEGVVLSSYALDFYLNGRYDDMIDIHGVAQGEAWELLLRYSKLLAALKKGLARLAIDDDDDMGDDDDFEDDEDEDVTDILKKSNLYQHNTAIRGKLTVPAEHKASHIRTAKAFSFVYKQFSKHFTSISRDNSAY